MNYKSLLLGSSCLLIFLAGVLDLRAQTIAGTFESPVLAAPFYKINPTVTGWVFSTNNAGIAKDGSKYNTNGDYSPYGAQYAVLDPTLGSGAANISYKITVPATASQLYTIYFAAIQAVTNTLLQNVTVTVSGATTLNLGTYTPYAMIGTNYPWGLYQTPAVYLNTGTNTITISTPAGGGGQAVLIDNVTLAQSTTQSNGLAINGLLDVSGNLGFGTYEGGNGAGGIGSGALLSYNDTTNGSAGVVGFSAAGASASFLWQDTAYNLINYFTNTPQFKNKMLLDGNNNLTIYKPNGTAGLVFNPASGGGITFPDGTIQQTAASLNQAGVVWNTNTSGGLVVSLSSFSVGSSATASGYNAVALGSSSAASGLNAVAFGNSSTASGSNSLVVGSANIASGVSAAAIGSSDTASGNSATAFGIGNQASGMAASAYGYFTKAASYASVSFGQFNVGLVNSTNGSTQWITTDPEIEVGNGVSGTPSDSLVVFKNGELRTIGYVQSQSGFLTPPTGDLSMGSFTNGNNPSTLIPTNGLKYPNGL